MHTRTCPSALFALLNTSSGLTGTLRRLFKHLAESGATYAARQPVVETTPLTVGEPNGAREPAAERDEPQCAFIPGLQDSSGVRELTACVPSRLEREKQPERRTREDDRRERAAEERGRKRERQREKIEWQGRRSGERADDAHGPDKRRREELREERASGKLVRLVLLSMSRQTTCQEMTFESGLQPCAVLGQVQSVFQAQVQVLVLV